MKEDKEHLAFLTRMRELMKLRHGREFAWTVLGLCDLYVHNADHGKRAVGIDILQLLESVDPTLYPRMILENQQGDSNGRTSNADPDSDDSDE